MRTVISLAMVGVVVTTVGCGQPPNRLNAPPQGTSENPSALQDAFVYMVDNAMLEDLSMADIHFVPHSADLNGLGARRLERYAKLLQVYGGGIRFATNSTDKEMVDKRIESIEAYLATTGITMKRIKIARGLPGGEGMTAREAILAKNFNMPSGDQGKSGKGAPQSPLAGLGAMFGGGK